MSSDASRTDATESRFSMKLTPLQREALIANAELRQEMAARLSDLPDGPQTLEFTWEELQYLAEQLPMPAVYTPGPDKPRIAAVLQKVRDIFDRLEAERVTGEYGLRAKRPADTADLLFQFKLTLRGIEPSIWRRIQVRDCTLGELHFHLQRAFGWDDSHMHQFVIGGDYYGPPSLGDFGMGPPVTDEDDVLLSELLPQKAQRNRWEYEYDFGDCWKHEILFEGYPTPAADLTYPVCLAGKRACPPEDCGGVWGYSDYLADRENASPEELEDLEEWWGDFDPDAFDPAEATERLRR